MLYVYVGLYILVFKSNVPCREVNKNITSLKKKKKKNQFVVLTQRTYTPTTFNNGY